MYCLVDLQVSKSFHLVNHFSFHLVYIIVVDTLVSTEYEGRRGLEIKGDKNTQIRRGDTPRLNFFWPQSSLLLYITFLIPREMLVLVF